MKVTAYICDCCNNLCREDEVMGLSNVPDMFDPLACYKSIEPDKSQIHFCLREYADKVTDAAGRLVDRKKHEEKYKEMIKELGYSFFHSVEYKYRQRVVKELH